MRTLNLRILRGGPGRPAAYQTYQVSVDEHLNILDAVQKVWATQDPTLLFRHACHHASCGLCGVRVNGRERLMCLTPVAEFPEGATVTLEPLRNFPWMGDLVVDVKPLMERMAAIQAPYVRRDELTAGSEEGTRFEDCIECGLCMSACPVVGSDSAYLGPSPLAMIKRLLEEPRGRDIRSLCALAGDAHGAWRCHSVMECVEVCPSNVDPSQAIGWLRRYLILRGRRQPAEAERR